MNSTRDPFNLRTKKSLSALSILQSAANKTAAHAVESTKQAVEATKQAIQDSDMSFAIPRNVPNFESAQRKFEDNVWSKIPGNEKGLPMYKDKPSGKVHGYGGGARGRRGLMRSKRGMALVGLVVLGLLYWFGSSSRATNVHVVQNEKDRGKSLMSNVAGSAAGKKSKVDWEKRRQAVKDAFLLSWGAYEEHGWGYDEYHPVSRKGRYMAESSGLGWIIVDALDTLMIMNLTKELNHARQWISTSLDYDKKQDVNTFETTIRMLGGLLSAHYLQDALPGLKPENANEEDLFLERATDLADRLMGAYESPSGVPWASVVLRDAKGEASHADGGASSTAEATTLQLEMKYLAYLTGEAHYWDATEKVMQVVDNNGAKDGLVPIFIYADRGTFRGDEIRWGSRGDSYYEYLPKQYLQTNKQEPIYQEMWNESLAGAKKHLLTYTKNSHLTVLAERPNGIEGPLKPKMDHLVCFLPGTIALATTGGATLAQARKLPTWGKQQEEDITLARELTKTCMAMYKVTATGPAPEIAHFELADPPRMYRTEILSSKSELDTEVPEGEGWKADFDIKPGDVHNLQRPETVESLHYMWRITGDEIYREWGWDMFQAFVNHTLVEDNGGFSSIGDVTTVPPPSRDNMESFWLAETLKYMYLLFSPNDILPLDQIVFNTEAHPFPRFDASKKRFKTGWERLPRDKNGILVPQKVDESKTVGDGKMVEQTKKAEVSKKVEEVEKSKTKTTV